MSDVRGGRTADRQLSALIPRRIPCSSAAFVELSGEVLRAGKSLRFRARGTSMAPLVRDGDVVLVRPVEPSSVRVGDVVFCSSEGGRVVVHRVVRRVEGCDGPHFMLQGDGVARPDGLMPAAQVSGQVVALERDGGYINMDGWLMTSLSKLAALRSRWNLGRGPRFQMARQLIKRLPVLDKYLA